MLKNDVKAKKCIEHLTSGGLSQGQYVDTIKTLAGLEPATRTEAWEVLKNELTSEQYWQVYRDYRRVLKRGYL